MRAPMNGVQLMAAHGVSGTAPRRLLRCRAVALMAEEGRGGMRPPLTAIDACACFWVKDAMRCLLPKMEGVGGRRKEGPPFLLPWAWTNESEDRKCLVSLNPKTLGTVRARPASRWATRQSADNIKKQVTHTHSVRVPTTGS